MAIIKTAGGWRLDYRDDRGRRHRKTYRLKAEAEDAERTIENALADGTYCAPKDVPTFETVAAEWLLRKQGHRPSSRAAWQTHLTRHLTPVFGHRRLHQIDVAAVERFQEKCRLPEAQGGSGLSPQTVNKLTTTLAAVLTFAVRRKYTATNPARDAERLRVATGELMEGEGRARTGRKVRMEDVLDAGQVRRLLAAATPGFARTFLLTACLTGARHSELLALQWGDVDLDAGTLRIRRSLVWARDGEDQPVRPQFYEPKTEAGIRTVPAPPELVSALRVWKLRCPPSAPGLVFPSPDGKPLHRSSVLRQCLYPALGQAKLPHVTLHSLRHTYASLLIANGAPVTEVQHLLGHSSPQVTLGVYSHWFTEVKTGAVAGLAKVLCGPSWTLDGHLDTRTVGKAV